MSNLLNSQDIDKIIQKHPSEGHKSDCLGQTIYGITTMQDINNYLYQRDINVEASIEPSKNVS